MDGGRAVETKDKLVKSITISLSIQHTSFITAALDILENLLNDTWIISLGAGNPEVSIGGMLGECERWSGSLALHRLAELPMVSFLAGKVMLPDGIVDRLRLFCTFLQMSSFVNKSSFVKYIRRT